MKRNLWKDLFRTIKNSIGRFLAIAGICAIGIGFFAGLQNTCGDMKTSLTNYYNNTNMMDIRIVGSLGLSNENVDAIKKIEGVDGVMPSYESDISANFGNEQSAVRVHSLPDFAFSSSCKDNVVISNDNNYINRQILTRGDWPKNPGDCVLSDDVVLANPPQIGDEIEIKECSTNIDNTFSVKKFKVVGFVHSSYYVNAVQMGPSSLGKGKVDDVAYVNEKTFSSDFPYSEVFVTVKDAKNYTTGSDQYQQCIDDVMAKIGKIAPEQSEIRSASIRSKAQEKIDEAKNEFNNQKNIADNELSNNEKKLNDAKAKIDSGEISIDDLAKLLDESYAEFQQKKNSVIAPLDSAITYAQNVLNTADRLLKQSKTYNTNLEVENRNIENQHAVDWALNSAKQTLSNIVSVNRSSYNLLNECLEPDIAREYLQALDDEYAMLVQFIDYCQAFADAYKHDPNQYEKYIEQYRTYYALEHDVCFPLRQHGYNYIISYCSDALNDLRNKKNQALISLNVAEKEILDGYSQLDKARADLAQGKTEYLDGLNAFIEGKASALAKLDDAQKQLDEGQSQINNLDKAKFYIMDRTKNFGAINFNNDADRIASIANVFPLIFFFVALLVVLTSMTRMIEEERITIGTYKALGFSRWTICQKYIAYGLISSFAGSLVGILILCQFLPWVIMFAYSIMYKLPIPFPMPYDVFIVSASMIIGIGLTVITTFITALKSLKLVPARLMIPSAPKAGKRILLEYIRPFWKLLNFNWKITLRNMFLYKKRLFMTIIGIAGCTALLLTGFGLHDSISDIIDKQFADIMLDNFKIVFNQEYSNDDVEQTQSKIREFDVGSISTLVHEENVIAQPMSHPNASVIINVPKEIDKFETLRILRNRETKEQYSLDDSGVYISEKLATMMQLSVGDEITVCDQDLIGNPGTSEYKFKISGIFENYIAHYIYMTPNLYKQYFNKDAQYNGLIARASIDANDRQSFVENIEKNSCIKTAYFTDANRETYERMLGSVNMVVVILIVSAAILAFIVLYNLININICERAREIATLKVLGCRRNEISSYIHRETILLSLIGSLLGIALGFLMEHFVILSSEVDYVMFGRDIYWWSIALSVGITMIFTLFVVAFMRKKIVSISMVESLKSE